MENHLQTLLHSVALALILWVGFTVNETSKSLIEVSTLMKAYAITSDKHQDQIIQHEQRIDSIERLIAEMRGEMSGAD